MAGTWQELYVSGDLELHEDAAGALLELSIGAAAVLLQPQEAMALSAELFHAAVKRGAAPWLPRVGRSGDDDAGEGARAPHR